MRQATLIGEIVENIRQDCDSASLHSPMTADVAIVGAGPVGMMLALKLAALGVASVLIEQDAQTLWHPKGNTHNARTMEHYRSLGLADALRELGLPAARPTDVAYLTRMNGKEIYRHRMLSTAEKIAARDLHAPLDQQPEPLHRVNQMYVERLVSERVCAEPMIETCFGWRFDRFEKQGEGICLTITEVAGGRARKLETRYLVACDGPRSAVRESLGIRYIGEDTASKSFMGGPMIATYVRIRPDARCHVRPNPAWQYWLLLPDKIVNLVTLDGKDEYIFSAPNMKVGDNDGIKAMVVEALGFDAEVEVLSTREWMAGRALVADHYRAGSVFLCGDSAHLFTPTGGFGMNTGIDDAVNLGWKLGAMVQGWGGPLLLDTYEQERRPIGVRNSTRARGHAKNINDIPLGPALSQDGDEGDRLRAQSAVVLATLKEEFASLGIQLGARYDESQIVATEPNAQAPEDDHAIYHPTSLPGGRAPHLWLPDGGSLFDLFGSGFTLLRFEDTNGVDALVETAAARGIPLEVVDIRMPLARTLYPRRLALVRPDQHVAWRGDALDDPARLLDLVTGHTVASHQQTRSLSELI